MNERDSNEGDFASPSQASIAPAPAPGAADDAGSPVLPLVGASVLLVHPAWHSCGSHQVFASQARAYRSLGARVVSLAIADSPGANEGSRAHKAYLTASADLEADERLYAGLALPSVLNSPFLRAARRWAHGDFAAMLIETTRLIALPAALARQEFDLIHCNHFFCMPAARRAQAGRNCAILLDTHDLQARQYALRNEAGWTLPPKARFEDMLAVELEAMRGADILIHLNDEEARAFSQLLPGMRHALLYPAVAPISARSGGSDLIIIASANYANFLGVVWFLTDVLPLAPGVPVRILGNIDREFGMRAPVLFKKHADLFCGRVDDLDGAYRNALAVLLPTTEGHGVSIKTIEAMSSGAPLIATPHAFRGLGVDPSALRNVSLAADAASFADALRRVFASRSLPAADRLMADTRALYERVFSAAAYRKALQALIEPLLAPRS